MSREKDINRTTCGPACPEGACAGACARSSGGPLLAVAIAAVALWAATGERAWLLLAGLSAASGALWWLAAKWANGRACHAR